LGTLFGSGNPEIAAVMATVGAAMAGLPKGVPADPSMSPQFAFEPPIVGGPQTVLNEIRSLRDAIGAGRLEMIVIGGEWRFPHEMKRNHSFGII
jgi:hypothetical protein